MQDGARILEFAHKAHFLYLKQPPEEQAKLLKLVASCSIDAVSVFLYVSSPPTERTKLLDLVLSNCSIDAASIYPTYRKWGNP